jgi:serine/threonine-protein kinase
LTPLAGIPGPGFLPSAEPVSPSSNPRAQPPQGKTSSSHEVPPHPFAVPPAWPLEDLAAIEKQLALFIGPMAKVAVKRASARTSNLDDLYEILASSVANAEDKKNFLAGKKKGSRDSAGVSHHASQDQPSPATTSGSRAELTPEATEQAARLLARYVGPLANVLVKRASQRAGDLRGLYEQLAEHIESKPDRTEFLRNAGFPQR